MTQNLTETEQHEAFCLLENILNNTWNIPLNTISETEYAKFMDLTQKTLNRTNLANLTPEIRAAYLDAAQKTRNLTVFLGNISFLNHIPAVAQSLFTKSSEQVAKYTLSSLVALGLLSFFAAPGIVVIAGVMVVSALFVEELWELLKAGDGIILSELVEILGITIEQNGNYHFCHQSLLEKMFAAQLDMLLWQNFYNLRQLFETAEATRSPLILDLDGDGTKTFQLDGQRVYFDHDGNGFAERTGWAGPNEGILVRDLNGNGQIDNGAELFGDNTILSDGSQAANGFEALKELDSDNNGVFDSNDAAWNEVKVWKDANSDAKVDEGELLTLEQAGIQSISLNYEAGTDNSGNNGEDATESALFFDRSGCFS